MSVSSDLQTAVSELGMEPRAPRREIFMTSLVLRQAVEHEHCYDYSLEVSEDELPKDDVTGSKPHDFKKEIEE
ncbi:hypothetical protein HDU97_007021 [Phlyctochytrium planicorne]|nr:hypothetical protein HDU97_007021 [Phlyctochytrium planicorne]